LDSSFVDDQLILPVYLIHILVQLWLHLCHLGPPLKLCPYFLSSLKNCIKAKCIFFVFCGRNLNQIVTPNLQVAVLLIIRLRTHIVKDLFLKKTSFSVVKVFSSQFQPCWLFPSLPTFTRILEHKFVANYLLHNLDFLVAKEFYSPLYRRTMA